MCNQYEAHKVYFFSACIKYDVVSTSPTIKSLAQGHTRLKIPI